MPQPAPSTPIRTGPIQTGPIGIRPIQTGLKIAALCLAIAPFPAQAQETEEGPGLMERGIQMFLRGLMDEVGPEITQMQDALKAMQPEFEKLITLMGDFQNYQPPERLPNGDILIRRKPDAPPVPPAPGTPAPGAPGTDPDSGLESGSGGVDL